MTVYLSKEMMQGMLYLGTLWDTKAELWLHFAFKSSAEIMNQGRVMKVNCDAAKYYFGKLKSLMIENKTRKPFIH
jgi:hypothetical protein